MPFCLNRGICAVELGPATKLVRARRIEGGRNIRRVVSRHVKKQQNHYLSTLPALTITKLDFKKNPYIT